MFLADFVSKTLERGNDSGTFELVIEGIIAGDETIC